MSAAIFMAFAGIAGMMVCIVALVISEGFDE
jgi:ABC-type lipoprotein release transport system permease subunit